MPHLSLYVAFSTVITIARQLKRHLYREEVDGENELREQERELP